MADLSLPASNIKRIVTNKLTELQGADGKKIQVSKDALLALGEAAKVFIHYVCADGWDKCKDKKKQTLTPDEIFRALEDTGLSAYVSKADLEQALAAFKAQSGKKGRGAGKKRAREEDDDDAGDDE
ncbi:unnamed protein product [Pedinophyceae sp. YPF-701]|nr:unnamed protein product [Pedinophyceae sp. YPF-701]